MLEQQQQQQMLEQQQQQLRLHQLHPSGPGCQ
jgi:hypothetical protein